MDPIGGVPFEVVHVHLVQEEVIALPVIPVPDLFGLALRPGLKGFPLSGSFILAGDGHQVEGPDFGRGLDPEQPFILLTETDKLRAGEGQRGVAGLDFLNDLILRAFVIDTDGVLQFRHSLRILIDVDMYLLADGSLDLELGSLLHDQGGEL